MNDRLSDIKLVVVINGVQWTYTIEQIKDLIARDLKYKSISKQAD